MSMDENADADNSKIYICKMRINVFNICIHIHIHIRIHIMRLLFASARLMQIISVIHIRDNEHFGHLNCNSLIIAYRKKKGGGEEKKKTLLFIVEYYYSYHTC
jgi:hypothetical protein